MGRIVIACYRPKPQGESRLVQLMRTHLDRLRAENLVTDRQPIIMKANDGTVIEVFEWRSVEAIEAAHSNPRVLQMWQEFNEVCDYVPIAEVAEAKELFSEFSPFESGDS